jgi:hypothetical protein
MDVAESAIEVSLTALVHHSGGGNKIFASYSLLRNFIVTLKLDLVSPALPHPIK